VNGADLEVTFIKTKKTTLNVIEFWKKKKVSIKIINHMSFQMCVNKIPCCGAFTATVLKNKYIRRGICAIEVVQDCRNFLIA